jgi:hypothetical protein
MIEEKPIVQNMNIAPVTKGFENTITDAATSFASEVVNTKDLYTYGGEKLGYVTRYPTYSPYRDNESAMAEQQGFWGKTGNTLGQFFGLAGMTIGNAISGYGREYDTYMSGNIMTELGTEEGLELALRQRAYQDLYPIYETAAQRAKRDRETEGIIDSATSVFGNFLNPFGEDSRVGNAWANLFGQLGFTAGTVAVVGAESLAISAVTSGAASTFAALRGAKTLKSLYSAIKQGNTLSTAVGLGKASTNVLGVALNNPLTTGYRMIKTAKDEAWVEAQSSRLEFVESQIEAEKKRLGRELTQEELQAIDDRSLSLAGGVYLQGIPIVAFGNLLTIKGMFKPKNFLNTPIVPKEVRGKVIEGVGNISDKSFYNSILKDLPKTKKVFDTVGKYRPKTGIKESFGEGVEEFLQGVSSRAGEHYYNMANSDVGAGLYGHTMGMFGEAAKGIQSKEGWEEIVSGILTGVIIGKLGSVANRVSGKTAKENELAKIGIDEHLSLSGAYFNMLTQQQAAVQSQEEVSKGNIKEAKDIDTHAELNLIQHLRKYDIFDEYVDAMATNFAEMAASQNTDLKDLLGDTSIDQIVSSLKKKNQEFTKAFNIIDKNVSNPFQVTDNRHKIYEEVKAKAAAMEVISKDSISRAKKLVNEVREEYSEVDQTLIDIIEDPSTIKDKYNTLAKLVEVEEELLKNAELSPIDRQARQEELARNKEKLRVVEKLSKEVDSDRGLTADFLNRQVLQAAFGEEGAAPSNFKRTLKDIAELNSEGILYMEAYNRLTNKETFEKFAENYVKGYDLKIRQAKERIDKASAEVLPTTPKEQSKQETENSAVKNFLDRVTYNPDTEKFVVDNVPFDTIEEAAASEGIGEDTLNEVNANGKTNREVINQTDYTEPLLDEEESLSPQAVNNSLKEEKSKVDGMSEEELVKKVTFEDEPKKKSKSEETFFNFIASKGHTILHNFSVAIGFPITYNNLEDKARKIGDLELIDKLRAATSTMNGEFYITNISLVKERDDWNINDEDIKVIHDGIRYFIVTKGNKADSIGIIQEKLKIKISPNKNSSLVINENGDYLQSDFLDNDKKEERAKSIAKVKVGTKLQVIVADTQFNIDLKQEYENSEKKEQDKEKYLSKVELAITSIDDVNDIYGTLRAGDFLYLNDVEEEYIKQIRTSNLFETGIGQIVVGLEAIAKTHKNTRGFNYNKNGELQYITLTDFEKQRGDGVKTEYFLVDDNGDIYNEKQAKTDSKDLTNRTTLSKGAIYMKVTDRNGAIEVSQVFKGIEGNDKFTIEEFASKSFKNDATTNVSPTTPIASQRLEVKIQQASNTFNTSIVDDIEDIVEEFEEVIEEEVVEVDDSIEKGLNLKVIEEMEVLKKMYLDENLIPVEEEKVLELLDEVFDSTNIEEKIEVFDRNKNNLAAQRGVVNDIEKIISHENFNKKNVKALLSGNGILDKINEIKGLLAEIKEAKEQSAPKTKTKKLFKTTSPITVEVDNINVNIPQGTVYDKEKGVLKVNNVDIKVEDITKVVDNQQATTETPLQETETPLEETTFQNLTESKEIFEYLKNNAIIGQPLTNVAGDTFTLLEEKDDTKLIRVKDKQGEFYIAIKGNQVQEVSFDNDFFAAFETIFDILPIDQREELTPDSIVESFNRAASKYAPNLGESILIALREAYVQSVRSGRPTINLGALVELSDMTEDEKNIFNSLLSSSFHASIVRYITKSEVIYNIDANRKWNAVRNELGMSAEYLELSDPSITPTAKYENAVGNKMGQIENLLNSIGIKLSLPKTFINNETKQAITNSLKAAIDKDTYKEAYKEVKKGLIDTGIKVTNTASKLREVADNLLGYDLEQDYINTFSRQLEEMRNGKVADNSGAYVEVKKLGTLNTSLPIITTTKQVLKDKGIELSLDVIAASLKVNGKLNPLMIAVNKHLKALEIKDTKEIDIQGEGDGYVVSKIKKEIIKYKGENYLPFGTDYEGNIVYYNPSNKKAYENIKAKVDLQNKQTNGVEVSKQNFNNERIRNKTNNKTCK